MWMELRWSNGSSCSRRLLLQNAEKEAKNKGEKERYKPLNAEFQRIAINKKAFLGDQFKEIEGNNRMKNYRSLQENYRYQGNISCKYGHNKGHKCYGPNRSRKY